MSNINFFLLLIFIVININIAIVIKLAINNDKDKVRNMLVGIMKIYVDSKAGMYSLMNAYIDKTVKDSGGGYRYYVKGNCVDRTFYRLNSDDDDEGMCDSDGKYNWFVKCFINDINDYHAKVIKHNNKIYRMSVVAYVTQVDSKDFVCVDYWVN